MAKKIPGLNIQWPWSQMLLTGQKIVETRSYSLPKKFESIELAVIETPGKLGKKAGIFKARIVGTIKFKSSFRYESESEWQMDSARHCVPTDDVLYAWEKREQVWGWEVESFRLFQNPLPAPVKKGIVFATECLVTD